MRRYTRDNVPLWKLETIGHFVYAPYYNEGRGPQYVVFRLQGGHYFDYGEIYSNVEDAAREAVSQDDLMREHNLKRSPGKEMSVFFCKVIPIREARALVKKIDEMEDE